MSIERIREIPFYVWMLLGVVALWISTRLSIAEEFPEEIGGLTLDWPLANWVDDGVSWLLQTFGDVFDAISTFTLQQLLLPTEDFLTAIPWPVFLAAVAILAFVSTRSIVPTVVLTALMFMIGTFGFWDLAMITLAIIIISVFIALLIGLPIGILAAQSDKLNAFLRPILDGMQTMPSFVYLIPAMMFFGLGKVPAVMATVIYAVPPLIRLTTLGIRGVSQSAIEAAEAYGATRGQILRDVELPLALPAIMAGVNQTTMMALAMVVIASLVGAAGLGEEVLLAINRIEAGRGFEAGLSIVALAVIIDRITQGFAKRYEESIS
ncbi:MAG: ABC transporter permease [Chloroflexota bacterium]